MGLHQQVRRADEASILGQESAGTLIQGFLYFATDTQDLYYARETDLLSAPLGNASAIVGILDTNSVDLTVDANGNLLAVVRLNPAADNDIDVDANGLYSKAYSVHPDSVNYMEIDAQKRIRLTQLAISRVTTNTTSTSLAAALTAAGYNAGNLIFQEGDTLILTAFTGGTQIFIHNGGSVGTSADFTRIESPNIDAAFIRAQISSGNAAIGYNSGNGQISLVLSTTPGNDLSINASGLFVDVSAAPITDVQGLLGTPAANVTLQSLINALAAYTQLGHMQDFTVAGNLGPAQAISDGQTITLEGQGILEVVMSALKAAIRFNVGGATTGQVPVFNGSTVVWGTVASGGSSNTFSNGLTDTSGVVTLGGPLTANTAIDLATFALTLLMGTGKSVQFPTSGNSRIVVDGGDIELLDAGTSIIIRSPNNTRWRVGIDNDGSINTTVVV